LKRCERERKRQFLPDLRSIDTVTCATLPAPPAPQPESLELPRSVRVRLSCAEVVERLTRGAMWSVHTPRTPPEGGGVAPGGGGGSSVARAAAGKEAHAPARASASLRRRDIRHLQVTGRRKIGLPGENPTVGGPARADSCQPNGPGSCHNYARARGCRACS